MEDPVHTLEELVTLYENGDIKVEGKVYPVYMTSSHKKNKSIGWMPDSEFPSYLQLRKDFETIRYKFLWKGYEE
jgi:hypothetical protein